MLTLIHKIPKLKVDSLSMFMGDVASLLKGYRHVCCVEEPVAEADPELNMYLLSTHVLVDYGASEKDCAAMLTYCKANANSVAITVSSGNTKNTVILPNAPPIDRYANIRKQQKLSTTFNLGVFFGEKVPNINFLEGLAINKPKWCTILFTSKKDITMPAIYERLIREHTAVPCRFSAGAIDRYLNWIDALAVDQFNIPERICAEAAAAALPVIIGDIDKIINTVIVMKDNREQYTLMRRQALEKASRNDLTCAISSLYTTIERTISWKNTIISQSEQMPNQALMHVEACI